MYETYFGLTAPPFQLNPDPAFYFESKGHGKALAYLRYGMQQGEGFIVITGEVGAGKTTLVRALMSQVDGKELVAAQLSNTQLDADNLLQAFLTAFGVPTDGLSKAGMIAKAEAFLTQVAASGRRALLIVDEAQNLSTQAIEELRMLSNFQLGRHGLLQSFLVGQPELRNQLQAPSMEQLRQRVLASYHLGPLDAAETCAYVRHRLRRAGWKGRPEWSETALARIHVGSAGIPRRINQLCNRVLLAAYLGEKSVVSAELVDETAHEMGYELMGVPVAKAVTRASSPRTPAQRAAARYVDQPVEDPAPLASPDAQERPTAKPAAVVTGPSALRPQEVREARVLRAVEPPPQSANDKQAAPVMQRTVSVVPAAETASLAGVPRRSKYRVTTGVILAMAGDAAGWDKLEVLVRSWRDQSGSRPPMMPVLTGSRADAGPSWMNADPERPALPCIELECPEGPVGRRSAALNLRFAELIEEVKPSAFVTAGTGFDVLQCALMAHQQGIPVIRIGAGEWQGDPQTDRALVTDLLERSADLLCVSQIAVQQQLVAQGMPSTKLVCVGHLTPGLLHAGTPQLPLLRDMAASLNLPAAWVQRAARGYAVITAQIAADDLPPADAMQWLMLARHAHEELPLLWALEPQSAARPADPAILADLERAGIARVTLNDRRLQSALLSQARCIISGPAQAGVHEAQSHGVPSVVLHMSGDHRHALGTGLITHVGPSAAQLMLSIRRAVREDLPAQPSGGAGQTTAAEAVQQIAQWLEHRGPAGFARHARTSAA